jgi:hypothetical protein
LQQLDGIQVPVDFLHLDDLPPNQETCSLLSWISQKDCHFSLRQMSEQCVEAVALLDQQALTSVRGEADRILQLAENDQNKKINKIEGRLYELDKLLSVCRKLLNDQELMTAAFVSHQQSAQALQDPSIFPDLCESHTAQLQLMFNNYLNMAAIAKKFNAAKMEFVHNLHTRLRVIVSCETEMSDLRWKIFVYQENLRKLKRSLEVLEQVNAAPEVYSSAIREITRRRRFSAQFRTWSTALAEFGRNLYLEESERRADFKQLLDGHFLKAIFIGLDDELPEFAVRKPADFDMNLPDIPASSELSMPIIDFPELNCPFCTNETGDGELDKKSILCSNSILMSSNQPCEPKEADAPATVEKSAMDFDEQISKSEVTAEKADEKEDLCDQAVSTKPKEHKETYEELEQRLRKDYELQIAAIKAEMNAKLEEEKKRIQSELEEEKLRIQLELVANQTNRSKSALKSKKSDSNELDQSSLEGKAPTKSDVESDSGEPPAKGSNVVCRKSNLKTNSKKHHKRTKKSKF